MTGILFFTSFAFSLLSLSGTVPAYRDSGDLVASIHTLGIAHPPGYALYILIGKLFVTLLPFGNIAYRVNVMSAVFAAGTVAVLYKVLCRAAGGSKLGVLGVALLFAGSPAVLALSRVAEMYTLSAFLAALILYALGSEDPRGICWAALLLGLGLSVHPTLIFLTPLFFMREQVNKRASEQGIHFQIGGRLFSGSLAPLLYFVLGLTVFLYLPIRAAQHPDINWGDPSQWRNFWRVVTRADYGGLKLHPEQSVLSWTPGILVTQLKYFIMTLKGEWGWPAFFLGFWGMGSALREPKTRSWSAGLLAAWLLSGPGFFLLSNLPLEEATTSAILQPYLLVVSVLWAPFVLFGFKNVISRVPHWRVASTFATLLLVAGGPWRWTSERHDFYAYDYARNVMRSLPFHAVLFDPDDPTLFTLRVLQLVEKRRPDIVTLSFFRTRWGYEAIKRKWPDLLPPISIGSAQELERFFWSYSARRYPFYADLPQKFTAVPYDARGLVYAARGGPEGLSGPASRARAEALLEIYVRRGDFVTTHHTDFFARHIISYYAAGENNLGAEYATSGDWARSARHYRRALEIEPDQNAARANLSSALQKMPKLL